MKIRALHTYIIVVIFLVVIGLTMVQTIFPVIPLPALNENRNKAVMPVLRGETLANGAYMADITRYFNDHYGFRDALIRSDKWIDYHVFHFSSNPEVLIGKNDFLFISDTLNDYHRIATLTEQDADAIGRKLKTMQDDLAAKGISFLFTIGPNTNTIYGEEMPFASRNPEGISNYDLVKAALARYKIRYLDVFPLLFAAKKDYLLYYKRDSHWNRFAGALVADRILRSLDSEKAPGPYVRIKGEKPEIRDGDLNILLGIDPRETTVQPDVVLTPVARKFPKTIWIHDSYSWAIFPYVQPFIGDFNSYHYSETAFYGVIASRMQNAKIMVFEIAERALPLLKSITYDFYKDDPEFGKMRSLALDPGQCAFSRQVKTTKSADGLVQAVTEGDDPQWVWGIPGGTDVKYLYLGLRVPIQSSIQIFWNTMNDSEFSETRSALVFTDPLKTEYIVDLRKIGRIKMIRVDPCNRKDVTMAIRSMKIYY